MINRQKHKKACGPTAIFNALQWLGHKYSYKEILSISEIHGFKYNRGMSIIEISNVLEAKNINHKIIRAVKLKDIIKELDNKNGVLFYFYHSKNKAHFSFIDKYTKKYVRAWNLTRYNKTPMISRKKMSNFIRYSNRWAEKNWCGPTYAIIIEKTNE